MSLPFPLFIGLRYVRSRRRARFVSVVSLVALLGLGLGVMALIVVLSVMNGFDRELHTRILALVPHALVRAVDQSPVQWQELASRLEREPGVRGAAPYIGGTAMLSAAGVVRSVALSGIRPQQDRHMLGLDAYMREGSLDDLQPGRFGIVIGSLLARSLGAQLGGTLTVMLPEVTVTPAGVYPRMRRFEVVGIFAAGAQVDSSTALINLEDAARLYRTRGGVHAIRLAFDDPEAAPEIVGRLREKEGAALHIEDWSVSQGNLFSAIRMEKRMVTLLLMVIIAVAAFNIVSILTMVVAEKRGAIAVLRTMGASPLQIMMVFTVQGLLIGFTGLCAGMLAGVPVALNVGEIAAGLESLFGFQLFDPQVYFISHIPSQLRMSDLILIAVSAMVLSIVATLYPARRAASIGPAEVLRYE